MAAPTNGTRSTSFGSNLVTLRTALIFASGFLLALFLARVLPGSELFHPEARFYEKDIVIASLNGQTLADLRGIATADGESFGGEPIVWDGDLLRTALEQTARGVTSLNIPARIAYVVPREGVVATLFISAPD